ncbi:hypothetical protein L6452_16332 [Arctium lappa]|uniref:Uncharacterized protein n=1 Tax=Arctium lappa TaxID=4217 RepID=A0ACB9C081_ARCLA|nr:hypothetical protein L6452_16332 [Arctium lappa]
MEKKIAVFTVFTFLLFAVSTARIFDDGVSKSSPESVAVAVADSDIVLSNEKPKPEFDETAGSDRLPEIEKTQTLDVSAIDPTQRLNFARLHPIKRHFFDKTAQIPLRFVRRHPCRKFGKTFMIPRSKASYGNDMILSGETYSFDPKTLGDDHQVPTKWLEFKHNYGHHHHHHHDHHHDKDEEFEKYMLDQEKMLHSSRHHKEKRENNGRFDFMKRIRKFLKHTFD